MRDDEPLPLDYAEARRTFLRRAGAAGAVIESTRHPSARAPDGGELAVDVVRLGPAAAERVLLIVSGIHGVEGPAGSAAQSAWLAAGERVPAGVAVVLVHALNPWGFAHHSRYTEEFVDLNRNFLDDYTAPPENPHYERVHRYLAIDPTDAAAVSRARAALLAVREEVGETALILGLFGGQYRHDDGLSFGGRHPTWSHRVMRDVLTRHLSGCRKLAFIDWHTGVGAPGEIAFLFPYPRRHALRVEAASWWGAERVENWTQTGASVENEAGENAWLRIPGQLRNTLPRWVPQADVTGATIEFGVELDEDVYETDVVDRWMHLHGFAAPGLAALRPRRIAATTSSDAEWQRRVRREGVALTRQALEGLAGS